MATNLMCAGIVWLAMFSMAIAADDAAVKIRAVLEEKTAAQANAYNHALSQQLEAAKVAEEKLKALVTEQANKAGEGEAIKARNLAIAEREQLEAAQKTVREVAGNLADLQNSLKKLQRENGDYKTTDTKRRDEMSSLRIQLSKAESQAASFGREVEKLRADLDKCTKPNVKPVPKQLADTFEGLRLRWNWVDLRDCKHDTKTWYEAKAFLKSDSKDASWHHYPMTDRNFSPEYDATLQLKGLSPYSDNLVEIELTNKKTGAPMLMLWNVRTNVIFPLIDIPYCAAQDPRYYMHGPAPVEK